MKFRVWGEYHFQSSWFMFLLAVLGMFCFASLGRWQLHRGSEKAQILAQFQAQQRLAPALWKDLHRLPENYTPLLLAGQALPSYVLLDNQYHAHSWGYHVLTPLQVAPGQVVMVDRGWVKGDPLRQHYPELTLPTGQLRLEGMAYYPKTNPLLNDVALTPVAKQAFLAAQFDVTRFEQVLHQRVLPFVLRLSPEAKGGYIRDWQVVVMGPERHQAYAVQWYALSGLVLIIFIGMTLRKK